MQDGLKGLTLFSLMDIINCSGGQLNDYFVLMLWHALMLIFLEADVITQDQETIMKNVAQSAIIVLS